jgi:hypothetical protein
MRKIENGICQMPLRNLPHPEPVEGRTGSRAADLDAEPGHDGAPDGVNHHGVVNGAAQAPGTFSTSPHLKG